VGNLLAPFTNAIFLYGLGRYLLAAKHGEAWQLAHYLPHWLARCYAATLGVALVQAVLRIGCCARVYGWGFASVVPLRMLWGNVVNSAATAGALRQFWKARSQRRSLTWLKTDHVYPSQVNAEKARPRVGEILVKMRFVSTDELEEALRSLPTGRRIGEHLMYSQRITEENLYQALSSQAGIPLGLPELDEVNPLVTRVLPAAVARQWNVIPYRVAGGELHVLTPEVPSREAALQLAAISKLDIRFRLVRPVEFEALARKYLPRPVP